MNIHIPSTLPPQEIGTIVADSLASGEPYVHLTGMEFPAFPERKQVTYIQTIAQSMGTLTLNTLNPRSSVMRVDKSTNADGAYVPFHTDNPYYPAPEQIVGLWSAKGSEGVGEEHRILSAQDILECAATHSEGENLLKLVTHPLEFRLDKCIGVGPILSEAGILRFDNRYVFGYVAGQIAARFSRFIESGALPGKAVRLSEGEALFFNNRTVLHAHQKNNNTDQVSYRVRLNLASRV